MILKLLNIKIHASSRYVFDGQEININEEIIKEVVSELISEVEALDLSTLTDVYFPFDYKEGVLEFQLSRGSRSSEVTENDTHTGFGMVIEYFNQDQEIKSVIFYHPVILLCLIALKITPEDVDISQKNMTLNILYHELFHVHDLNFYQKFCVNENLDMSLYEHFYSVWSEYFAHRGAASLFSHRSIEDKLDDVKINDTLLREALLDGDHDEIEDKISLLARDLGDIHSLGLELNELLPGNSIHPSLRTIEIQLNELFNKYPNWNEQDLREMSITLAKDFYLA